MLDFSRSGKPSVGFNGGAAKSPRLASEAKNQTARLYNRVCRWLWPQETAVCRCPEGSVAKLGKSRFLTNVGENSCKYWPGCRRRLLLV
jgi:hypothetical protein